MNRLYQSLDEKWSPDANLRPRPNVSVIIVNYACSEATIAAITSIKETSGDLNIEIIMVDNSSPDASTTAIKNAHSDINVIQAGYNGGYAWGNNVGIYRARGDKLLILNPDTVLKPGALCAAVRVLNAHPDIGIIGPRTYWNNGQVQSTIFRYPTLKQLFWNILVPNSLLRRSSWFGDSRYATASRDDCLDVEVVAGCFMLMPRNVIEQVGPMDDRFFMYSEEVEWCWRVRQAGYRVVYCPDAEIEHVGQISTGRENPWKAIEIARGQLLFLRLTRGVAVARLGCVLMLSGSLVRSVWMITLTLVAPNKVASWWAQLRFLLTALVMLPEGQEVPPPEHAGFLVTDPEGD